MGINVCVSTDFHVSTRSRPLGSVREHSAMPDIFGGCYLATRTIAPASSEIPSRPGSGEKARNIGRAADAGSGALEPLSRIARKRRRPCASECACSGTRPDIGNAKGASRENRANSSTRSPADTQKIRNGARQIAVRPRRPSNFAGRARREAETSRKPTRFLLSPGPDADHGNPHSKSQEKPGRDRILLGKRLLRVL